MSQYVVCRARIGNDRRFECEFLGTISVRSIPDDHSCIYTLTVGHWYAEFVRNPGVTSAKHTHFVFARTMAAIANRVFLSSWMHRHRIVITQIVRSISHVRILDSPINETHLFIKFPIQPSMVVDTQHLCYTTPWNVTTRSNVSARIASEETFVVKTCFNPLVVMLFDFLERG